MVQKIWQNHLEPHQPDFHTFFSLIVKICQIFILFLSPSQNLPDFHTFSVSQSKFARFSYFFSLPVTICQIVILFQSSQNLGIGKLSTIEEISESYFKMSNPHRSRSEQRRPGGPQLRVSYKSILKHPKASKSVGKGIKACYIAYRSVCLPSTWGTTWATHYPLQWNITYEWPSLWGKYNRKQVGNHSQTQFYLVI